MVIRNKDPCQPCRVKKIPSPKLAVVSPKPAATTAPRMTRQAVERPSTINLGNTPVFESQEGLDALATIKSNNHGARDNSPDLLETCSTKPVVIPRKRRLFRESPPAKFQKKQKLDGSPMDTFESEMKVSVPAWITEKLKTIPDFPSPLSAKKSRFIKNLFGNTRNPVDCSNNSVQSASTSESEKEESLRSAKPGVDAGTSQGGCSTTTTTPIEEIDHNTTTPSTGKSVEHDPKMKGTMGALPSMSPVITTDLQGNLENPEVDDAVEVEGHDPPPIQTIEEEPQKTNEGGKEAPGMVQGAQSKLDRSEAKEMGVLPNGKGQEKTVDVPVESEPHNSKTACDVAQYPYSFERLSTNEYAMADETMTDNRVSAETIHTKKDLVATALVEQGCGDDNEQRYPSGNSQGSASGEPGNRSDNTLDGTVGGIDGGYAHSDNMDVFPQGESDAPEEKGFIDISQWDVLEVTREQSAQTILNVQQKEGVQQSPERDPASDTLSQSFDRSSESPDLQIASSHYAGVSISPGPTPWNRTPRDASLEDSEVEYSPSTRRKLWLKEQAASTAPPAADRARWRDSAAGPSRFSGARIFTPLRSAPFEPGMGLIDTTRYSQHEGLWNMVTNDYLAKFDQLPKDKEQETSD